MPVALTLNPSITMPIPEPLTPEPLTPSMSLPKPLHRSLLPSPYNSLRRHSSLISIWLTSCILSLISSPFTCSNAPNAADMATVHQGDPARDPLYTLIRIVPIFYDDILPRLYLLKFCHSSRRSSGFEWQLLNWLKQKRKLLFVLGTAKSRGALGTSWSTIT